MKKLTAVFEFTPTYPLFVKRSGSDVMRYEMVHNECDVAVELNSQKGAEWKRKSERNFSFGIDSIGIYVSKAESVPVPEPEKTKSGGRSYVKRAEYLAPRREEFSSVAFEILKRLLLFFRYRLNNPLIQVPGFRDTQMQNPRWVDDEGREYEAGHYTFIVPPLPGLDLPFCGVKHLTKKEDRRLQSALKQGVDVGIHEEVLSDARDAVSAENYRRAVIELASAIELAVKRMFFSENTAAGNAFEYLEDKGWIRVAVKDLLHGPSERAFGESFMVEYKKEFEHIEEIFQARNKAVHRGSLTFRNKHGKQHVVDLVTINKWWQSVEILFDWLSRQSV